MGRHQPLVVQHRFSVDVLYWCKRNKRTLVVLVLVLEGMKERARVRGRAGGMCRRKGKGEHGVGGERVLGLVVLVLKSKGRRW